MTSECDASAEKASRVSSRAATGSICRDQRCGATAKDRAIPAVTAEALRASMIFDDVGDGSGADDAQDAAERVARLLGDSDARAAFADQITREQEAAPPPEIIIPCDDAEAWLLCWGPQHTLGADGLLVDGAIRSARGLMAEPGATYVCHLRLACEPAQHNPTTGKRSGDEVSALVGPIALDTNGNIIQSPVPIPSLQQGTSATSHAIELIAEPTAHQVFIGVQGPNNGTSARVVVVAARLERRDET